MADFARWACAVEVAMGWQEGTFMAALAAVEHEATQTALEGSPIARLLLSLLNDQRRKGTWHDEAERVLWRGTMTDLLKALKERAYTDEGDNYPERSRPGWPKGPRALTSQVLDIAPYLRARDWRCAGRRATVRAITRWWIPGRTARFRRRSRHDQQRVGSTRSSELEAAFGMGLGHR